MMYRMVPRFTAPLWICAGPTGARPQREGAGSRGIDKVSTFPPIPFSLLATSYSLFCSWRKD